MEKEILQIKEASKSLIDKGIDHCIVGVFIERKDDKMRMLRISTMAGEHINSLGMITLLEKLLEQTKEITYKKIEKGGDAKVEVGTDLLEEEEG